MRPPGSRATASAARAAPSENHDGNRAARDRSDFNQPRFTQRGAVLLPAVVLLGVLIRFPTLGQQSFWTDEAATHGVVSRGFVHVLTGVSQNESTPPLYYVLLWLWSRVFGTHEAALRSFSAVCGGLTVPAAWVLGRRLVSERVGLIAALLTAVNPLMFWYSQEARAYALAVLLSACTMIALLRALQQPTSKRLLMWGLVAGLALSTHYFTAIAVAPEAAWLLVALHRGRNLAPRTVLLSLAVPGLTAVALTPLMLHQNDGRAGWLLTRGGSLPYRVAELLVADTLGYQPQGVGLAILAGLLVLLSLVLLSRRSSPRERQGSSIPLVVGVGGLTLAVLVSLLSADYINTRNLLPIWPALMLVAAIGFGASGARRTGTAGLLSLVAVSLGCLVAVLVNPNYQRPDWRGAAHALGPIDAPRAIVAGPLARRVLSLYLGHVAPYPSQGVRVRELDVVAVANGELGSRSARLPDPDSATPNVPGFTLRRRTQTKSYVVFTYQSVRGVAAPAAQLVRLEAEPRRSTVFLQP